MFSLTQLLHRYSLLVPWLLLAFSSEMIIIYLQKSVSAQLTSDPEHSWPPFDFHLPFYLGTLLIFIG